MAFMSCLALIPTYTCRPGGDARAFGPVCRTIEPVSAPGLASSWDDAALARGRPPNVSLTL